MVRPCARAAQQKHARPAADAVSVMRGIIVFASCDSPHRPLRRIAKHQKRAMAWSRTRTVAVLITASLWCEKEPRPYADLQQTTGQRWGSRAVLKRLEKRKEVPSWQARR